jgi:Tol biopolymer transport system component
MMKPFATKFCTALLLIGAVTTLGAQTSAQADKLLESARHKEVMEGDLKGAVEQYRKIAAQFAKQPDIAARALFQLGQCQEKLGQAEARKSYERIVREYGGAQQYASAARARLVALGGDSTATQPAARVVWTGRKVDAGESPLSPDGRFMTFPDWDTGNLGLHDLVTGEDRLLTHNGSWKYGENSYAETSAISRDGKQVVYGWHEGKSGRYELWVQNLNGDSTPRRLFGRPDVSYLNPIGWTPDGKWIAVDLDRENAPEIALIGVQDGSMRTLKSGNATGVRSADLSHDGKYIVYSSGFGAAKGYILSVDGKSEAPLVAGTFSTDCLVWNRDDSRIIFRSDLGGAPALWNVRVRDGRPVGDPEMLKVAAGNACGVAFASDNSFLYSVSEYQTDIYVAGLDPATGKLTSEPRRVNQQVSNSGGRIAWLPDSKSLSFWNRQPALALVMHNLATGEEGEIWGGKSGRAATGYTGWFPDGLSIMSRKPEGEKVVFRRMDSSTWETKQTWIVPNVPPISEPLITRLI